MGTPETLYSNIVNIYIATCEWKIGILCIDFH